MNRQIAYKAMKLSGQMRVPFIDMVRIVAADAQNQPVSGLLLEMAKDGRLTLDQAEQLLTAFSGGAA